MMVRPATTVVWWWATVSAACGAAPERPPESVDFRVHTTVVADDDHRIVAENLTIFFDQFIYDFPLDSSQEATIFHSQSRQFTLLDGRREVQCRLTGEQLLQLITALQQRAGSTSNPQIRFAANPTFQESFDPSSLRLTLAGKPLTYTAIGKKPQVACAARQYRQFADWFARLNAPETAMPPEARLRLNEALGKRQLLPERIWRRIPGRKTYSSKHVFGWRLEKTDLQRVDKAKKWSLRFRQVSFDRFRRRGETPSTPGPPR